MDIFFNFLDIIKINVEYNYYYTLIIFFIILIIFYTFGIPGNIIYIASTGYFFGFYIGFFLSITTIVIGSLIFFLILSKLFKFFFPNVVYKYSNKIEYYISDSSLEYLIIFRMIPGPPLLLQNLILSILNITISKFIFSTFIGFIPFIFLMVLIGDKLNDFNNIKSLSIIDIFSFKFICILSLIIFFIVIRIILKKKNS